MSSIKCLCMIILLIHYIEGSLIHTLTFAQQFSLRLVNLNFNIYTQINRCIMHFTKIIKEYDTCQFYTSYFLS